MNIKYYLVNGVDRSRDEFMLNEFDKCKINRDDVMWMKSHNKTDLSDDFCGTVSTNAKMKKGQISCTYKHYLAIKHIVENNIDIGVVMEDNIEFNTNNFPERLNKYLEQLPEDWGILFESDTGKYYERTTTPEQLVYPKTNMWTNMPGVGLWMGGTNAANCYIIPYRTAKQFYKVFLPFSNIVDHYYNDLLRKFNVKTYWAVPPVVHRIRRRSTLQHDD